MKGSKSTRFRTPRCSARSWASEEPPRQHLTPVLHSAASGQVAEILIESGADVNAVDADGKTALMGAALLNQGDVAQVLLARGADAHVRDNRGKTALGYAKQQGAISMIALLERAGAVE